MQRLGNADEAETLNAEASQRATTNSFCIAVGDALTVDRVSVFWGDGQVESWFDLPVDVDLSLVESSGMSQRQDR